MSKNIRSIGIIIFIGVLIYFRLEDRNPCSGTRKWFMEHEYRKEYSGPIARKYLNPEGRFMPVVRLTDSSVHDLWNGEVYDLVKPGDIFIKRDSTLQYLLVRIPEGDTVAFYQMCRELELK